MKKIAIVFLLTSFLVHGCKKGNEVAKSNDNVAVPAADVQPTANFRIGNLTPAGDILEANITDFQNLSQNGNTYHWDFGNGITSDNKIPQGISFAPCGGTNTITLTVINKLGQTSTYSQAYTIFCRGKNANHPPITVPIHISTSQIPGFLQNL